MGRQFLGLPARASRGEPGAGDDVVIGTSIHLDVVGLEAGVHGPESCHTFLGLVVEPATGVVLDCRPLPFTTGTEAYEEVLWGFLEEYLTRSKTTPAHRPSTLTTSDPALADYCFGLLQGTGTDVVCVDMTAQKVLWPAPDLRQRLGLVEGDPLLHHVWDYVLQMLEQQEGSLVQAGTKFQAVSSCHNGPCAKLQPRNSLQRCGGCKTMLYCGRDCQAQHWKKGGHKSKCKELMAKQQAPATPNTPQFIEG